MLASMALEYFLIRARERGEIPIKNLGSSALHGKITHFFVDLYEVYLPSKFHVYTRSLGRSKGQETAISRHLEFMDSIKNP